ncbi:unnamed protein product [Effrenium voratum]|nr:unnamed protein product [Effrenium voratum]
MAAKKKLAAANATMRNNAVGQNEKAKKVLGTFLHGSTKSTLKSILASWVCMTRRQRIEGAVHQEYKDKLERLQKQLRCCKRDQLTQVRTLFMRQSEAGMDQMKRELFASWRDEVEELKIAKDMLQEVKMIEEKLGSLKVDQATRMSNIIESVAANANTCLVTACIRAWQGELGEAKKDLELETWLKTSERRMKQMRQANKDLALANCERASAQFDEGLLSMAMRTWIQTLQEGQAEQCHGRPPRGGGDTALTLRRKERRLREYVDADCSNLPG